MSTRSICGTTRPHSYTIALLTFLHLTSYLCACQSIVSRINQLKPAWHCNVDSFEYTDEYDDCAKAYDSNDSTFWHTQYTPHDAPLPHRITIDLGKVYKLRSMTYLPRQDGNSNGNIGGWRISLSENGQSHRLLNGSWSDDQSRKTVDFDIATPARYFELHALSEAGDRGPWSSAAQIDLYEETDPNAATYTLPGNSSSSSSSTGAETTSGSSSSGSSSGSSNQDDNNSSSQDIVTASGGDGSTNDQDTVTISTTTQSTTIRGAQTTTATPAFSTTVDVGSTATSSSPESTDQPGSGNTVTSVVSASTTPSSGGGVATVTATSSGEGVNGTPGAGGSNASGAMSGKIVDFRIAMMGLAAAVAFGLIAS
ncbi:MAG: hypothetical protein Q9220_003223 [cf. Caloplaca sp. 1 TL-2023]